MEAFTVYIDIDNTIVNFTKQAVEKFNKKFKTNKDYKLVKKFDFEDLFPILTDEERREIYFKGFYNNIEKFNIDDALLWISENFKIIFITKGNYNSLREKEEWLKNNLNKKIKYKFIGLPMEADKTEVDMSRGIIIDDQNNYLENSNASIKILYADGMRETEWNDYLKNINGYIVKDWEEVVEILKFVKKKGIYFND